MLEKACHEISSHSYSFAHTHIFLQSSSFSSSSFFLKCELWNKVGTCVCVFSFLFSVLVHWGTDLSTEYIFLKDMLIPPPQSILLCSPLPLWLINPLSIIWSQSITPFYRLSGGITISLFGAPLRMADPYQTEATPWTKEPLWSSLHSATNVSISIGCSCCTTVCWDFFRSLSAEEESWWMRMIQSRLEGVHVSGQMWRVLGYLDTDRDWEEVETECSLLKDPVKSEKIAAFVLRLSRDPSLLSANLKVCSERLPHFRLQIISAGLQLLIILTIIFNDKLINCWVEWFSTC